jgi:hypothetical protein
MTKEVSKVGEKRNAGGRPKGTEKTGGRTKGTPNKKTLNFIDELGNFKPVQELLNLFAYTQDDNLKFAIIKEILKYVYPQRKAVEVSTNENNNSMLEFMQGLKEVAK